MLLGIVALTACADEPSREEQEAQANRDVALVEKANSTLPPLHDVVPEPIGAPDIERFDLYGQSCNYAPGTSLGTRVVSREADAFVKIEGKIERFAADPGARELPQRTRSLYNGREYVLRLRIEGDERPAGNGRSNYEGAVSLLDRFGRVVYEGDGLAQCGP
jgi:hypothetical protein